MAELLGGQEFVDRSFASDFFRPGYDAGVKLNGSLFGGLGTYDVGAYDGSGQSQLRAGNGDNTSTAIAARVAVNPFGRMPYSESDLDATPKPLLSIGANYYGNTLRKTGATTFEGNSVTLAGGNGWLGRGASTFNTNEKVAIDTFGVDTAFKWVGAYAQGEYLYGHAKGNSSDSTLRAHGFYVQAGYCVIPKTLELAVRYSFVDPDRDATGDLRSDTTGAVSYYFDKHNLKLQGDITNTHDQDKGSADDMTYRLQAQVIF